MKKSKLIGIIISTVLIIGIVAGVGIGIKNSNDPYGKQIKLAYKLLDEGNYEEAILAFDKAIEIDLKRVKAYVGKADVYVARGDEKTLEDIKAVMELAYNQCDNDKDIINAFIRLSDELKAQGHTAWAKKLLDFAYELTGSEKILKHKEKLNQNATGDPRGEIYAFLSENYEGRVYGVEDITLLGHGVYDVDIYTGESILRQLGYKVENYTWFSEYENSNCYSVSAESSDGLSAVYLNKYENSKFMSWGYGDNIQLNGMPIPIGFCDIKIGDTYEEFFRKLGFVNADGIVGKLNEIMNTTYATQQELDSATALWNFDIWEDDKKFSLYIGGYSYVSQEPYVIENLKFAMTFRKNNQEIIHIHTDFEDGRIKGAGFDLKK